MCRSGLGYLSYDDFLNTFREPLNERRLSLVKATFSRLDRNDTGIVDASEVAQAYNASKHPEVLSGSKTAEEVYAEFLDTYVPQST